MSIILNKTLFQTLIHLLYNRIHFSAQGAYKGTYSVEQTHNHNLWTQEIE